MHAKMHRSGRQREVVVIEEITILSISMNFPLIVVLSSLAWGKTPDVKKDDECACDNHKTDSVFSKHTECHLQMECTSKLLPFNSTADAGGEVMRKIRIPVRAAQGSQGPAGPRGPQGLKGPPGQSPVITDALLARIVTSSNVIRQLTTELERRQQRVAFFASLPFNIDKMPENQRVIMNQTLTNVGEAYDPERGEFCAPVDGVYSLLVTISAQGEKQAAVRLMHNENHIFDVWSDSKPWSTATNQAILSMKKGDCAWLKLRDSLIYLHGYMYSTFGGYLIFEHPAN